MILLQHNELFNENCIHTYYSKLLEQWDYRRRDTQPYTFLNEAFAAHMNDPAAAEEVRAVGYKSFHDQFLEQGKPYEALWPAYKEMLGDSEVRKVLLYRENVFAVYLSSQRSLLTGDYLTKDYSSLSIYISVPGCQEFVTRYQEAYRVYQKMTRGQQLFTITYEEMLSSETKASKLTDLFNYLGVDSDVIPKQLSETTQQNLAPLQDCIQNYAEIEFAWRHTKIGKHFLPPVVVAQEGQDSSKPKAKCVGSVDQTDDKWALLLPIRSFSPTLAECCERLSLMKDALDTTTTEEDRATILLVIGVDSDDQVYNSEDGGNALSELFSPEYMFVVDVL